MPTLTFPVRRSLFFTHRKNEESWRLTEKIAAILEGKFVGEPGRVFTFSTAFIPNGTPYPPPVDVAYSVTPDPFAPFAFVQVKDHEREKVGREFIDEVIGQRVQTGVSLCTVVSTTGFTAPALELARSQAVRLRVLTPGVDWPYEGFLPPTLGLKPGPRLVLRTAALSVSDGSKSGVLELAGESLRHPVLEIDGDSCSVVDEFSRSVVSSDRRAELDRQIEDDPKMVEVCVVEELVDCKAVARTPEGEYAVSGVAYLVDVLRPGPLESAVTRRYRFHDPLSGSDLAWCALADFRLGGFQDYGLEDGAYHYCLCRCPDGEKDSLGAAFFPE